MDLEAVFLLISLVMHWRVVLCLISSSWLAIVLVHTFPWLSGLQGIALAILGFFAGVIWETHTTDPKLAKPTEPPQTTTGVACASALIAGCMWGTFSASSMHSFFAGIVIFAFAAWGWIWYAGVMQPPLAKERTYLCVVLAAIAFPIAAAVSHNAL